MKKPIVVANWKATKTIRETIEWLKVARPPVEKIDYATVVICSPFTCLPALASLLDKSNIKVGAQNVSRFKKGAYTGEITVEMLDGLLEYCIVGHSERRKYFGEDDDDVIEKVKNLLEYSITPVLCVSNLAQLDSYIERGQMIIQEAEKIIFVYEPPSAISGGGDYHPENPAEADDKAAQLRNKVGKKIKILYGGSVNPENMASFCAQTNIDGVLPGQASVDPVNFLGLLKSLGPSGLVK